MGLKGTGFDSEPVSSFCSFVPVSVSVSLWSVCQSVSNFARFSYSAPGL